MQLSDAQRDEPVLMYQVEGITFGTWKQLNGHEDVSYHGCLCYLC